MRDVSLPCPCAQSRRKAAALPASPRPPTLSTLGSGAARLSVPAIGINVGTTNSCVGIWSDYGLEIISNEKGKSITASCVAFTRDGDRILVGDRAKDLAVDVHPSNTVFQVKRLIGRRLDELQTNQQTNQAKGLWPNTLVRGSRDEPGGCAVSVTRGRGNQSNSDDTKLIEIKMRPEEIAAMIFKKMKEIAETRLGCTVRNAVVSVPASFTLPQKLATKEAAAIAGLEVMRLITDPSALVIFHIVRNNRYGGCGGGGGGGVIGSGNAGYSGSGSGGGHGGGDTGYNGDGGSRDGGGDDGDVGRGSGGDGGDGGYVGYLGGSAAGGDGDRGGGGNPGCGGSTGGDVSDGNAGGGGGDGGWVVGAGYGGGGNDDGKARYGGGGGGYGGGNALYGDGYGGGGGNARDGGGGGDTGDGCGGDDEAFEAAAIARTTSGLAAMTGSFLGGVGGGGAPWTRGSAQPSGRSPSKLVMVVDWGGGCLDVAIVNVRMEEFAVIAVAGDTQLGGRDIDDVLLLHFTGKLERVLNQNSSSSSSSSSTTSGGGGGGGNPRRGRDIRSDWRAMSRLRSHCEDLKHALSSSLSYEVNVNLALLFGEVTTSSSSSPSTASLSSSSSSSSSLVDFKMSMTRRQLEELLEPIFQKVLGVVKTALSLAQVAPPDISEVISAGGSMQIPRIQELLSGVFGGRHVCRTSLPSECVAYGAAIQAALMTGQITMDVNDLEVVEVVPTTLGFRSPGGNFVRLIERNTPYPTKAVYSNLYARCGSTWHRITIYEGERGKCEGNHLLGGVMLEGLRPGAPGSGTERVPLEVALVINEVGILTATLTEKLTGRKASCVFGRLQWGRWRPDQTQMAARQARELGPQDRADVAKSTARWQLRDYIDEGMWRLSTVSDHEERERLRALMSADSDWLDHNDHHLLDISLYEGRRQRLRTALYGLFAAAAVPAKNGGDCTNGAKRNDNGASKRNDDDDDEDRSDVRSFVRSLDDGDPGTSSRMNRADDGDPGTSTNGARRELVEPDGGGSGGGRDYDGDDRDPGRSTLANGDHPEMSRDTQTGSDGGGPGTSRSNRAATTDRNPDPSRNGRDYNNDENDDDDDDDDDPSVRSVLDRGLRRNRRNQSDRDRGGSGTRPDGYPAPRHNDGRDVAGAGGGAAAGAGAAANDVHDDPCVRLTTLDGAGAAGAAAAVAAPDDDDDVDDDPCVRLTTSMDGDLSRNSRDQADDHGDPDRSGNGGDASPQPPGRSVDLADGNPEPIANQFHPDPDPLVDQPHADPDLRFDQSRGDPDASNGRNQADERRPDPSSSSTSRDRSSTDPDQRRIASITSNQSDRDLDAYSSSNQSNEHPDAMMITGSGSHGDPGPSRGVASSGWTHLLNGMAKLLPSSRE
ncbi:hypothetical protein CBR_g28693 [Chara braunii]|uniref:Uncharacterized protein n=1 Tax=Chara braunii TaxID=69332 RepID=A0A388L9J3_CHABU|nr:hypothetical protein CBR_g28693 [Chara braunii]|eukprot:GBG78979.1 hypothetical protein CBR_g28693 [Chara braunii]